MLVELPVSKSIWLIRLDLFLSFVSFEMSCPVSPFKNTEIIRPHNSQIDLCLVRSSIAWPRLSMLFSVILSKVVVEASKTFSFVMLNPLTRKLYKSIITLEPFDELWKTWLFSQKSKSNDLLVRVDFFALGQKWSLMTWKKDWFVWGWVKDGAAGLIELRVFHANFWLVPDLSWVHENI